MRSDRRQWSLMDTSRHIQKLDRFSIIAHSRHGLLDLVERPVESSSSIHILPPSPLLVHFDIPIDVLPVPFTLDSISI